MEDYKEVNLGEYPDAISYECTKLILEQMEKCICKIKIGKMQGTGFFCMVPFPDKNHMKPILITNNHVINEYLLNKEEQKIPLDIKNENDIKYINLDNRMKYTNEEYDITIIEIKEEDNINNYLELDDKIINDLFEKNNKNKEYVDKTVYLIQYPKGELSVSYGKLVSIFEDKKYNFTHYGSTEGGSSGAPILDINNNKIIGIHKGGHYKNNYNKGTFIIYPLQDFIEKNCRSPKNEENESLLKEFNTKYNLDIPNTKIEKLNLYYKNIGNEGLKDLCNIEFKRLKKIDLFHNNISDINALEKSNFEKLEELDLGDNKISDINVLEKVNFKNLKILFLNYNKISDIKVLEKIKFEKLWIYGNNLNGETNEKILSKLKDKIQAKK